MMHRKITLALDPTIKPRDFKVAVKEEWKEDSEGKKGLDRERFDWCWCAVYAFSQTCNQMTELKPEPEPEPEHAWNPSAPEPCAGSSWQTCGPIRWRRRSTPTSSGRCCGS